MRVLVVVFVLLLVALGGFLWARSRVRPKSVAPTLESARELRHVAYALTGDVPPAIRSLHWTDEQIAGNDRLRTISNYTNYVTPAGLWAPSDPDAEELSSPPADWQGTYEFTHASRRAALQAHVGDSTDPSNTALLGVRLSARPDCWLNLKALGVNPVPMLVDRPARRASWADLWAQTDLAFTFSRSRVEKLITLKAPGHPAQFRFALRLPTGHTHAIVDGSLRVYDSTGAEWLHTPPAWAEDATGTRVRVALLPGADITIGSKTYPTIVVRPNATDLASATYPVRVDPTATISGTTDIEDLWLSHLLPSSNYGGRTNFLIYEGADSYRSVIRLKSGAIPSGTITGLRFKAYVSSNGATNCLFYKIKPANTWVEGTQNGPAEAGSGCWNYAKYNTQSWAGSAGCGTSGTDYFADASPPSIDCSTLGYKTATLVADWATDWRNTPANAQGLLLKSDTTTVLAAWNSTENASNQPYFEVDYTLLGGGAIVRPFVGQFPHILKISGS